MKVRGVSASIPILVALLLAWNLPAKAAQTLDRITSSRQLNCGVVTELDDYSEDETHGNLAALGADICKAVAAAVLGESAKVLLSSFPDEHHGLDALKSGKIDLLAGTTPRITMGALFGVGFGSPFFFDGQGFIVAKAAGIHSMADLAGKTVCFISNTEAETVLDAVLSARNVHFQPFPFQEQGEMEAALVGGHCAAMTGDISQLAEARSNFHGRIHDFVILPDTISLDPLAPAFRNDDLQWAAVVNWTIYALIEAESRGITRANVDTLSRSEDPLINRWLTKAGGLSRALGLADNWVVHVIRATGNYGEIFERDAGKQSPLQLDRGTNALWTTGGLMYPLPGR